MQELTLLALLYSMLITTIAVINHKKVLGRARGLALYLENKEIKE
jgi:hypothetical protein